MSNQVSFSTLYTAKVPLTAADTLNDRVVPFFEEHQVDILRILTDRGTEYCGRLDKHPYQLYLQLHEIEHTRTRARRPQSNGICERFHRTMLNEFYRIAFRKKIYRTLDELQDDVDSWLLEYNEQRPHTGKYCFGKTPMETFIDSVALAKDKMLDSNLQTEAAVSG